MLSRDRLIDSLIDILVFAVPIMEAAEITALIPPEYLPMWLALGFVARLVLKNWRDNKLAEELKVVGGSITVTPSEPTAGSEEGYEPREGEVKGEGG